MEITGPFTINEQVFTKEGLLTYASEVVTDTTMQEWEKDIFRFILDFFDSDANLVQKTSGTTGDPKRIILKRDSMVRSAEMTIQHFGLQKGDNILLCLPVHYIAGKMMVVRALVGELNLRIVEPSGNPIERLDSDVEFAAMVPLQVFESMKKPHALERIKKLIIGGGKIDGSIVESLQRLKHTEAYETFAMSETYTHFATRRLNGSNPETYFHCLPGADIDLDERGCLVVDIPGVTSGKVITNDIVEMVGKDKFKWAGRYDNILKSGGLKIVPEILEEKIKSVIDHELVVIGVSDEKLGQKLVLVVECDPGDAKNEQWNTSLTKLLSKHEKPKEIICIREFPRNRSMKIDRNALRELLER